MSEPDLSEYDPNAVVDGEPEEIDPATYANPDDFPEETDE